MADLIRLTVNVKGDITKWTDEYERRKNTALERTGAWTRAALIKQIRPSSSELSAGGPPRGHASGLSGLKDVRWDVDALNDIVRIGPRIYGQPSRSKKHRRGQTRQVITKNVVRLLDEGGTVRVIISYPKSGHVYVRTVVYRAFPWVTPTKKRAREKLLDFLEEEGFRVRRRT